MFSGIEAFLEALENLKIDFEVVNYCEWDKIISKCCSLIHNIDENLNLGDITKINETKLNKFDILVGGSPCTNISKAGNQEGLKGNESQYFYDYVRILNYNKPKYFVFENVDNLLSVNNGADWEIVKKHLSLHYNIYYDVYNGTNFNSAQIRKRIVVVGIRKDINKTFNCPTGKESNIKVKDILENIECIFEEDNIQQKKVNEVIFYNPNHPYYKSVENKSFLGYVGNQPKQATKVFSTNGYAKTLCANGGGQGGKTSLYMTPYGIRALTGLECFRLSGFKDEDYYILKNAGIAKTKILQVAGNTIVVGLLQEIFKELLK